MFLDIGDELADKSVIFKNAGMGQAIGILCVNKFPIGFEGIV